METRANYVAIGAFVFAVLIGAFLFILWLGGGAERVQRSDIKVVFPGAVTGLSIGGQVLYNGIRIGDVAALNFDPADPKVVIATVRVISSAPLRDDVTATLNFQGLTGVAYVELLGGTPSAPPLFKEGAEEPPVIYAERSAYDDIVEGARNVLKRADATLESIEQVVSSNKDEIDQTIKNVKTFSDALAENSDGIETFMRSMSATGEALTDLSGRLRGVVDRAETLLAAVPPEKVTQIVDNAADITSKASGAMDGLTALVDDARDAARQLETFSIGLNTSLKEIDEIIATVDPQKIQTVIDGAARFGALLSERSDDLDRIVADTGRVMANAGEITDTVRARRDDIDRFISQAVEVESKLSSALDSANGLLGAVDTERVRRIVSSFEKVVTEVAGKSEAIGAAIVDARETAASARQLADDLNRKRPDIDKIVADARTTMDNLTTASVKVQDILNKAGAMVEGEGEGFVAEATAAAASIRKVADVLAERVGPITEGLSKFTTRGSSDFSAAMGQLNQTLVAIQRAVNNLDRDPSRVIFGGSDLPTYSGAQRR